MKHAIGDVDCVGEGRRGQVTIEYFIIFAVIALLTVIGLANTTFHTNIQQSFEEFFGKAANAIATPDVGNATPGGGSEGGDSGGGDNG